MTAKGQAGDFTAMGRCPLSAAKPEATDLQHELPLSAESSHIRQDELAARFPKLPFMNALAQMVGLAGKRIFTPCGVGDPAISGNT